MINTISREKPRGWNQTAIDCFNIKCNCEKCQINQLYLSIKNVKCKMKYYVIEMLKFFGKPMYERI